MSQPELHTDCWRGEFFGRHGEGMCLGKTRGESASVCCCDFCTNVSVYVSVCEADREQNQILPSSRSEAIL